VAAVSSDGENPAYTLGRIPIINTAAMHQHEMHIIYGFVIWTIPFLLGSGFVHAPLPNHTEKSVPCQIGPSKSITRKYFLEMGRS
jgi:hypothetical protein